MRTSNPFYTKGNHTPIIDPIIFNILNKFFEDRTSKNYTFEPFTYNANITGGASAIVRHSNPKYPGIAITVFPKHIVEEQSGGIEAIIHSIEIDPGTSFEYERFKVDLDSIKKFDDRKHIMTIASSIMLGTWDWEKSLATSVGKREPSTTIVPVALKKTAPRPTTGPGSGRGRRGPKAIVYTNLILITDNPDVDPGIESLANSMGKTFFPHKVK
jgi:hypothetical protein